MVTLTRKGSSGSDQGVCSAGLWSVHVAPVEDGGPHAPGVSAARTGLGLDTAISFLGAPLNGSSNVGHRCVGILGLRQPR